MTPDRQAKQARARQIDWGSAEMRDGTLTIELTGAGTKGWGKDFDGVLALLEQSNHSWGRVTLTKRAIEVADVQEGSEADLRHFLESVVLQVNTDLELDTRDEAALTRDDDVSRSQEDSREAAERDMATTFRAFAEPDA